MPDYVPAWLTYRTLSNEDDVIARKLAREVDLTGRPSNVIDVGPGDGRVLVRFLIRANATPGKLTFVEPNADFFEETFRHVSNPEFVGETVGLNKKLEACSDAELAGHGVVLCTHTAYFLSDAELDRLLELVRDGAELHLVIDHPTSIFSQLWRRTAPTFHDRVVRHLEKLQKLDPQVFQVKTSTITAMLCDLERLREPIRNLAMSLLCYSDVEDFDAEAFASAQKFIMDSADVDGQLHCESFYFTIRSNGTVLSVVT